MKKILKWLSLLFAVSVSVFVIFLFYTINSEEPIEKPEPFIYESHIKDQESQALWLNHLSKTKRKGYFFPVDEVYIQTDLVKKKAKRKPYRLIVDDLDPYQTFCLSQELKRHKLKFFFKKDKNEVQLLVFSTDKAKLNSLVKVLKNYQIDATIKR